MQAHGFLMLNVISAKVAVQLEIGSDYLSGSAIRQDYLETAIDWISKGKMRIIWQNISMTRMPMLYGYIFNL